MVMYVQWDSFNGSNEKNYSGITEEFYIMIVEFYTPISQVKDSEFRNTDSILC